MFMKICTSLMYSMLVWRKN